MDVHQSRLSDHAVFPSDVKLTEKIGSGEWGTVYKTNKQFIVVKFLQCQGQRHVDYLNELLNKVPDALRSHLPFFENDVAATFFGLKTKQGGVNNRWQLLEAVEGDDASKRWCALFMEELKPIPSPVRQMPRLLSAFSTLVEGLIDAGVYYADFKDANVMRRNKQIPVLVDVDSMVIFDERYTDYMLMVATYNPFKVQLRVYTPPVHDRPAFDTVMAYCTTAAAMITIFRWFNPRTNYFSGLLKWSDRPALTNWRYIWNLLTTHPQLKEMSQNKAFAALVKNPFNVAPFNLPYVPDSAKGFPTWYKCRGSFVDKALRQTTPGYLSAFI